MRSRAAAPAARNRGAAKKRSELACGVSSPAFGAGTWCGGRRLSTPPPPSRVDRRRSPHLARALAGELRVEAPSESLSKSHVWGFSGVAAAARRNRELLSRGVRRSWARLEYSGVSGVTVLTPDPLSYRDSSNLYAFCAGD